MKIWEILYVPPSQKLHKLPDYEYFYPLSFSEIVLGEHTVNQDPDCDARFEDRCNPPVIRRGVEKIISHENFDKNDKNYANDIALVRLDKSVPLYLEDPEISGAKPICLPWINGDFGRKTEDVNGYVDFLFCDHLTQAHLLKN